jgi:hypothetical protein
VGDPNGGQTGAVRAVAACVKESHDLSVMSELRLVPQIALLCLLSSVACREGRALPRPETGDGPKKEKHAKKHDRRDERAERQGHGDKRGKADKDGKKDAASEPLRHPPGRFVTFQGACDASGAIPLDGTHFLLADDEDNVLRVYDAERGGPPTRTYDLSSRVALADPDSEVTWRPPRASATAATSCRRTRASARVSSTRTASSSSRWIWVPTRGACR